jgi:hypothetical protein
MEQEKIGFSLRPKGPEMPERGCEITSKAFHFYPLSPNGGEG